MEGAPSAPVEYDSYPHLDRTAYLAGQSHAVEAYSLWGRDYFALANENSGLHLYQVVDGAVVPLGVGDPVGSARDVAIKDWFAFVATGSGLTAINVAVPDSPYNVDFLNLTGDPVQVAISADRAFVACGSGGVVVVDISDPANLSVLGNYGTDVRAVGVDGDRLGIIHQTRFELLDASGPGNPVLLGSLDLGSTFWGDASAVLQGNLAYVSRSGYVKQLDIADPGAIAISWEDYLDLGGTGSLRILGDEVVYSAGRIMVFMDFASGAVNRESSQAGIIYDSAAIAGKIMCAAQDRLAIFEDGLHLNPAAQVINTNELMEPRGVVMGDILYGLSKSLDNTLVALELGAGDELLWSLDLGADAHPAWGLAHRGSTVAAVSRTGAFSVVAVSKYGAVIQGTLDLPGGFYTPFNHDRTVVFLDDQTVVVLDETYPTHEDRSLRVVDISDPSQPAQIGQYPLTLYGAEHVMRAGAMLVASSRSGYEVFDAQDRLSLQSVAAHDLGTGSHARDSYVYAFHPSPVSQMGEVGPERLDTWDISNPLAPVLIQQMNLNSPGNLVFDGDWAFQASSGLILDLAGPAGPTAAGNFSQPYVRPYPNARILAGQEYLAVEYLTYGTYPDTYTMSMAAPGATGAVSAVGGDIPVPGPGLTLQAVPNPFNPRVTLYFELPVAASARVRIYDLGGRLVADLGDKFREAGRHGVNWDGTDHQGRISPSGVYLVRVETPQRAVSGKVVLAR